MPGVKNGALRHISHDRLKTPRVAQTLCGLTGVYNLYEMEDRT